MGCVGSWSNQVVGAVEVGNAALQEELESKTRALLHWLPKRRSREAAALDGCAECSSINQQNCGWGAGNKGHSTELIERSVCSKGEIQGMMKVV